MARFAQAADLHSGDENWKVGDLFPGNVLRRDKILAGIGLVDGGSHRNGGV
jgi:hypothetical protein